MAGYFAEKVVGGFALAGLLAGATLDYFVDPLRDLAVSKIAAHKKGIYESEYVEIDRLSDARKRVESRLALDEAIRISAGNEFDNRGLYDKVRFGGIGGAGLGVVFGICVLSSVSSGRGQCILFDRTGKRVGPNSSSD